MIYQHMFKQIRCDVYSIAVVWFHWFATRNNQFLAQGLAVSSCTLTALAKSINTRFHLHKKKVMLSL
jgi:mevalonate pyrophosphate decarboxylase